MEMTSAHEHIVRSLNVQSEADRHITTTRAVLVAYPDAVLLTEYERRGLLYFVSFESVVMNATMIDPKGVLTEHIGGPGSSIDRDFTVSLYTEITCKENPLWTARIYSLELVDVAAGFKRFYSPPPYVADWTLLRAIRSTSDDVPDIYGTNVMKAYMKRCQPTEFVMEGDGLLSDEAFDAMFNNTGKREIHQDLRNEDPDRIAIAFRRDIEAMQRK